MTAIYELVWKAVKGMMHKYQDAMCLGCPHFEREAITVDSVSWVPIEICRNYDACCRARNYDKMNELGFITAPMTRQQILVLQKVFRRMRKLGITPVEREQIILQLNEEVESLRRKIRDLEERPMRAPERQNVLYLCDRRACERCMPLKPGCRHTSDVRHAKNFELRGDVFKELERADE